MPVRFAWCALFMLGFAAAQDIQKCEASGTVVNALTGEFIVRAMVSLGAGVSAGAATDDKGHWIVSGPICGDIRPTASRVGFFRSGYRAPNSNSRDSETGDPVTLVPNSPVRDLKISLMPEGSITGRIQDINGDPVSLANIDLLRVSVKEGRRTVSYVEFTKPDARGNFAFDAVPPGRYLICAMSREKFYAEGGGPGLIFGEECYPGPRAAGLNLAQLVRGNELHVSLTLRPVQGGHVRGSVTGANGAPVRIELAPMPADPFRDRTADGTLGLLPFGHGLTARPDGSFDISDVAPGSYRLEAVVAPHSGGEPLFAESVVEAGGGDGAGNVRLSLRPLGSVTGNIRADSKLSAAPVVDISLAAPSGFVFSPDAEWNTTHTGFTLPQIPPGQYQLLAEAANANQWIKSASLSGRDVLNQPLSVGGSAGPIEIAVSEETSDVDLTITAADGSPLPGDVILMPRTGHAVVIRSTPEGHIHHHGLSAGEYRAWAFDDASMIPWAEEDFRSQFASLAQKFEVKTGETITATLKRLPAPENYQ
jgi:hypothetical protein